MGYLGLKHVTKLHLILSTYFVDPFEGFKIDWLILPEIHVVITCEAKVTGNRKIKIPEESCDVSESLWRKTCVVKLSFKSQLHNLAQLILLQTKIWPSIQVNKFIYK